MDMVFLVMRECDEGSEVLAAYSTYEHADRHVQYLKGHDEYHTDFQVECWRLDTGVANLDAGVSTWCVYMYQGKGPYMAMDEGPAARPGIRMYPHYLAVAYLPAHDKLEALVEGRKVYDELMQKGWPPDLYPTGEEVDCLACV